MSKVITANLLSTGTVVFLSTDGAWVDAIARARRYADDHAAEAGLARAHSDAERAIIVEPFVADAGSEMDGRPAMTLRDTIRAYGPTIQFRPNNAGSTG